MELGRHLLHRGNGAEGKIATAARVLLAFVLLFSPLPCLRGRVFAATQAVAVVKGRDIGPYNEVAASLKKSLESRGRDIKVAVFDFENEQRTGWINSEMETEKWAAVVTLGTPATKTVRHLSSGRPVVYTMILYPTNSGIDPPGVMINISPEVKLREFKMIVPAVKSVGIIYSLSYRSQAEEVMRACEKLGLRLVSKQVGSQQDFSPAMDEVLEQADCFLMTADPDIYLPKTTEELLREGLRRKKPVIGLSSSYTKAGALVAFDCDYSDLGCQTAELVMEILDNKIEALGKTGTPRKIKFSLNLEVAVRLGIDIPAQTIAQAQEVFGR